MAQVLNALLPFAEQMLDRHGEFYPFATAMTSAGEIAAVSADVGEEHPEPTAVAETLYAILPRGAISRPRACASICD